MPIKSKALKHAILITDIKKYIKENYSEQSQEINIYDSIDFEESQSSGEEIIPGSPGIDISSIEKIQIWIENNKKNKFVDILDNLIKEKIKNGIIKKEADIYRGTIVNRSMYNKARNGKNIPTKKTVIVIAIGLNLDLYDTEILLKSLGYCLSESSYTDLVLKYCFENGIYDTMEIDYILDDLKLEAFFSEK